MHRKTRIRLRDYILERKGSPEDLPKVFRLLIGISEKLLSMPYNERKKEMEILKDKSPDIYEAVKRFLGILKRKACVGK